MQEKPKSYAVISVTQPVLQQVPNENVPAYVTYLVGGTDPRGQFSIRRRFRQFLLLRNKFVERFTGIYIPPIPSKRTAGNTEERYVQQRRKFLHYFCLKVAERPYLFDSDIFQTFIRGDPDFERACRFISAHEYALIANVYQIEFRKYADESDMASVLVDLQAESEILKLIEKKLTQIRDEVYGIADAKQQFVRDFSNCFKNILPKFEKQFIAKHDTTGDSQILTKNDHFHSSLDEYLHFCQDNLVQEYAQMLNYDIRQARALLEAIQSRKNLQSKKGSFQTSRRSSKEELQKLKSGRTTLKSIFTFSNKQAQIKDLQNQIPQYQRNETFLQSCLPLSAISIHRDIVQYKLTRSLDYISKLQILARKSIRLIDYYGNMLMPVLQKGSKLDQVQ